MEYFMVPAQKVPSLQHFRKTEKDVIGGLCRYVQVARAARRCLLVTTARSHLFFVFFVVGGSSAHAPKGNTLHPAFALLLCTRHARGPPWETNTRQIAPPRRSGRAGARARTPARVPVCYLAHSRGNRRILLRTNTNHVAARTPRCCPAARRIPSAPRYPRFTPPVASPASPVGCSDLRATS